MATFPFSFVMRSSNVRCGGVKSSKCVPITHCTYEKRVTRRFVKMDMERNLLSKGVAKSYQVGRLKVSAISQTSVFQTPKKVSTYLFRSEFGGQVKVLVETNDNKYVVYVEVSSLQLSDDKGELVMSWGIFRADSSSFMSVDFRSSSLDGVVKTIETPLLQKAVGRIGATLDFETSLVPFYFSFLLKSPSSDDSKSFKIRSHRKTNFCVPVGFSSGNPVPLGLSFSADGSVNFALFSRSAESVVLCLYDEKTKAKPALEIDLDSYVNRSGDIWHASINTVIPLVSYGYKCKGSTQEKGGKIHAERVVLDPYAKIIGDFVPAQHGSGLLPQCLGQLQKGPAFDWSGDVSPCLPLEKLVVYRLNVMRFTKDKSSKLPDEIAGTFSGITEKLHHFKNLGVNSILLEPVFPFDEQQGPYFPFHFFSLMNEFGPSGGHISTISSMKEMVKRLHVNGIEVFMEVVFTHTAEIGSLREIDSSSYHYAKEDNNIGRNTLNCNHPIVQQMILDSLRQWVIEFHIDGFCFINAGSLLRGFHGENVSRPPLVEAIAFDPILSKAKIIADSWDPHVMESKAVRFPHWKRWAEINSEFCKDVRNYLRGEGLLSNLATRLCGSGDAFSDGRGPAFSFNFIARNCGFSLVDLVSFSGSEIASERSWNCGEEGATNNAAVLETRLKQIRNFLFILFVSLGVPILNMGDECGQSSGGSPAYGDRKPFNWNALRAIFGIQTTEFISFLTSLRMRRSDLLQKRSFLREENIDWHGSNQCPPSWEDPSSKFLGMTLKVCEEEIRPGSESSNLFAAFNAADRPESVTLPPPPAEMAWIRLVDTALSYPGFFSTDGVLFTEQMAGLATYEMKSHSCILFEARRKSG